MAALLLVALISGAWTPAVAIPPIAAAGVRWFVIFLGEYVLSKAIDEFIVDPALNSEISTRLDALSKEATHLKQAMKKLEDEVDRLNRNFDELNDWRMRREAVYRDAAASIFAITDRVGTWHRYQRLVEDLHQLPVLIKHRDRATLESLLQRSREFEFIDAETLFVKEATALFAAHDAAIRQLNARVGSLEDRASKTERLTDAHGKWIAAHEKDHERDDEEKRNLAFLRLARETGNLLVAVERNSWARDQLDFFEPLRSVLSTCQPALITFRPEAVAPGGIL